MEKSSAHTMFTKDVPKLLPNPTVQSEPALTQNGFLCPITHSIMIDPVIELEGNTWERHAIEAWVAQKETSPLTGNVLRKEHLTTNRALRNVIEATMGPEFCDAEKTRQTSCRMPSTASPPTPRQIIGLYLEELSTSMGKNFRLNEQGIASFTYEPFTFVIEVPETKSLFFVYTKMKAKPTDANFIPLMTKCMTLNYLQQETRGGCLSLDPRVNEILFSYSDRVNEITQQDFRTVLENFIDAALYLNRILDMVVQDAAKNVSSEPKRGKGKVVYSLPRF